MIHQMKLNNVPFNLIKNGTKTIELRLYDEKRKLVKENDMIEFTNTSTNEKIVVEVIKLHMYPNFKELYKHFDKANLGYKKDEDASYKDMELYYTLEEQEKYGVVGIKLKLKINFSLEFMKFYDIILAL